MSLSPFLTSYHPGHLSAMSTNQADIAAIEDACTKHEDAHWQDFDYRASVFIGTKYFVKFGDRETLYPEFTTQSYISQYAESQIHHACHAFPSLYAALKLRGEFTS